MQQIHQQPTPVPDSPRSSTVPPAQIPPVNSTPAQSIPAVPNAVAAENVLDALGQGLMILDDRGRILSVNSTAASLLGRSADFLLGRTTTLPFLPPSRLGTADLGWKGLTRDSGAARGSGHPTPIVLSGHGSSSATAAETWNTVPGTDDGTGTPPAAGGRDADGHTQVTMASPLTMTSPSRVTASAFGPTKRRLVAVPLPDGTTRWLSVSAAELEPDERGSRGWALNLVDASDVAPVKADRDGAELRLRGALRLAGMATWERQLADNSWTWSLEMFALLGIGPGDPPSYAQWLSWILDEDRTRLAIEEQASLSSGRGWRATFRVRLPDFRIRHLKMWCEPVFDATGRPVTVLGTTLDVTDTEEAGEQLRNSRRRLSAAVHLTGLASWTLTLDTGEQWWSDSMYHLYGRDPAEGAPSALEHLDMMLEEDREQLLATFSAVLETGTPAEVTLRVFPPSGGVRHLRCWIDLTHDGSGRPLTLWGTALDITEEQQNLAALQASQEELRLAFDRAPTGMAQVDCTPGMTRLLRVNHALLDMLGLAVIPSFEDLLGRVHTADMPMVTEHLQALAEGETAETSYEVRLLRADNSIIHAWVHAAAAGGEAEPGRHVVYHFLDVTQRHRTEQELQRLALTDVTTGLANRARLEQRLTEALSRVRRSGRSVALFLLDLDRFKSINDTFGHVAGDTLLIEIGRRLRSVVPAGAEVARLGGDEFAVVVDPAPAEAALARLGRDIRTRLSLPIQLRDGASVVCTASIGVTQCDRPGRTVEDLYREADLALYEAKDLGRDALAVFDTALRTRADARIEAEQVLRTGLATDALRVRLQPVVDLRGGAVAGAEVLARVEHPDLGLLDPSSFIDVAEDTGLVVELDTRVSAMAMVHLASGNLPPGRWLAVNVSARTLEHEAYFESLQDGLNKHHLHPSRLLVEVTEHTLMDATGARAKGLHRLREMGVRVGIDDFGTGYSALAYLDRFAFDFLKIDRSFVTRLGTGSRPDAVVSAIISLAHAHGLVVTAEGVETPSQARALRAMGCDRAQGFLFGRPSVP